jgi:hypothetical protein
VGEPDRTTAKRGAHIGLTVSGYDYNLPGPGGQQIVNTALYERFSAKRQQLFEAPHSPRLACRK